MEKKYFITIIHTLITSRLNYYYKLYMRLPLETAWKLQTVQNERAQMLTGVSILEHTIPILRPLYRIPIFFCVRFKVLILIYKAPI